MNREIKIEEHKVKAIGLWWIKWQTDIKEIMIRQATERARRQAMSPRSFVAEHLASDSTKTNSSRDQMS